MAYTIYLILQATAHDALPGFSQMMLVFIIPLTVVTLLIGAVRSCRGTQKVLLEEQEANFK